MLYTSAAGVSLFASIILMCRMHVDNKIKSFSLVISILAIECLLGDLMLSG
jgi:hypothetical protein